MRLTFGDGASGGGSGGTTLDHDYAPGEYVALSPRLLDNENTSVNRAYLFPFVLPANIAIDELVVFGGGTVSGNLVCGIYNADRSQLLTNCVSQSVPVTSDAIGLGTTEVTLEANKLYHLQVYIDAAGLIWAGEANSANLPDEDYVRSGFPMEETLINQQIMRNQLIAYQKIAAYTGTLLDPSDLSTWDDSTCIPRAMAGKRRV